MSKEQKQAPQWGRIELDDRDWPPQRARRTLATGIFSRDRQPAARWRGTMQALKKQEQ